MYRRNLPHWHPPHVAVFVTWRLAGSLPRFFQVRGKDGHAFIKVDRILDCAAEGPVWLKAPEVAQSVMRHLIAGDGLEYELFAFVVMSNHVHLLLVPWRDLSEITRRIKGRSAREANLLLGRSRSFWQDESFDHWIRTPDQFE